MNEPLVYNAAGEPRSLEWLREKYGPFIIYDPSPLAEGEIAQTWAVTALREKLNAPAALVVRTRDLDGQPLAGIKVAWYWPDADPDPDCGPLGAPFDGVTPGRAVHGWTNAAGDAGFAMGEGAYYWPDRGERGPHAAWIHGAGTRSQLLLGLGMIAATNHFHFDVEFSLVEESGDDDDEQEADIVYWLSEIAEQLIRIADILEQSHTILPDPEYPNPLQRIATAIEDIPDD